MIIKKINFTLCILLITMPLVTSSDSITPESLQSIKFPKDTSYGDFSPEQKNTFYENLRLISGALLEINNTLKDIVSGNFTRNLNDNIKAATSNFNINSKNSKTLIDKIKKLLTEKEQLLTEISNEYFQEKSAIKTIDTLLTEIKKITTTIENDPLNAKDIIEAIERHRTNTENLFKETDEFLSKEQKSTDEIKMQFKKIPDATNPISTPTPIQSMNDNAPESSTVPVNQTTTATRSFSDSNLNEPTLTYELLQEKSIEQLQNDLQKIALIAQSFNTESQDLSSDLFSFNESIIQTKGDDIEKINSYATDLSKLFESQMFKQGDVSRNKFNKSLEAQIKKIEIQALLAKLSNQKLTTEANTLISQELSTNQMQQILAILKQFQNSLTEYEKIKQDAEKLNLFFEIIDKSLKAIAISKTELDLTDPKNLDTYDKSKRIRTIADFETVHASLQVILDSKSLLSIGNIESAQQQDLTELKKIKEELKVIQQKIQEQEDEAKLEIKKKQDKAKKQSELENSSAKTIQAAGKAFQTRKELAKQQQESLRKNKEQAARDNNAKSFETQIESGKQKITDSVKKILEPQSQFLSELQKLSAKWKAATIATQQNHKAFRNLITEEKNNSIADFEKIKTERKNLIPSITDPRLTTIEFDATTSNPILKATLNDLLQQATPFVVAYQKTVSDYLKAKHETTEQQTASRKPFELFIKEQMQLIKNSKVAITQEYNSTFIDAYNSLTDAQTKLSNIMNEEAITFQNYLARKQKIESDKTAQETMKSFNELAGAGLDPSDKFATLNPTKTEQDTYSDTIKTIKNKAAEDHNSAVLAEIERKEKKEAGIKERNEKKSKIEQEKEALKAQLLATQQEKEELLSLARKEKENADLIASKFKALEEKTAKDEKNKQDLAEFDQKKAKHLQELDDITSNMLKEYDALFADSAIKIIQKNNQETAQKTDLHRQEVETIERDSASKILAAETLLKSAKSKAQEDLDQAQQRLQETEASAQQKITKIQQQLQQAQDQAEIQKSAHAKSLQETDTNATQLIFKKEQEAQEAIAQLKQQLQDAKEAKANTIAEVTYSMHQIKEHAFRDQQEKIRAIELEAEARIKKFEAQLQKANLEFAAREKELSAAFAEQTKNNQSANAKLSEQQNKAIQNAEDEKIKVQSALEALHAQLKAAQEEKEHAEKAAQDLDQKQKLAQKTHEESLNKLKEEQAEIKRKAQEDINKAQAAAQQKTIEIEAKLKAAQEEALNQEKALKDALRAQEQAHKSTNAKLSKQQEKAIADAKEKERLAQNAVKELEKKLAKEKQDKKDALQKAAELDAQQKLAQKTHEENLNKLRAEQAKADKAQQEKSQKEQDEIKRKAQEDLDNAQARAEEEIKRNKQPKKQTASFETQTETQYSPDEIKSMLEQALELAALLKTQTEAQTMLEHALELAALL